MIKRRLYFLLPDTGHAGAVVNELEACGIERRFMHAIAGRGGMVDVPSGQVAEVEETVHRRHPEAIAGGVGWSVDALQF